MVFTSSDILFFYAKEQRRKYSFSVAAALCGISAAKFLIFIGVGLLFSGFSAPLAVNFSFGFLSAFMVYPAEVGLSRALLNKEPLTLSNIFYLYEGGMFSCFRLKFISSFFQVLFAFICLIPSGAVYFLREYVVFERNLYIILGAVQVFLLILGYALSFLFKFRFIFCDLIFADGEKNALKIIKQSFFLSKGRLYEFLSVGVMFLPYFALSVFIAPIFFILPLFKFLIIGMYKRQAD